jgi:hypothetical protein
VPYRGGQLADLVPDEGEIRNLGVRVALRVGRRLRELVAEYTPVSDDPFRQFPGRLPGTLRRSWRIGEVVVGGERFTVSVDTEDPVAPHVEWDTAPHRIRPRPEREAAAAAQGKRAMLAWRNRQGLLVFAHEVLHPGTRGSHMMARALDALEREWPAIVREELVAWTRGVESGN